MSCMVQRQSHSGSELPDGCKRCVTRGADMTPAPWRWTGANRLESQISGHLLIRHVGNGVEPGRDARLGVASSEQAKRRRVRQQAVAEGSVGRGIRSRMFDHTEDRQYCCSANAGWLGAQFLGQVVDGWKRDGSWVSNVMSRVATVRWQAFMTSALPGTSIS
ncbi:hypothetical protein CC85DRAFT_206133 [Cutaneotrichosporon oleaginosum]|uniref:Uncharacterized protein n=2 Tax=Cutaneotrichosporon oleaginosum TaxID=879819 RepID=A0A0J0XDN3_9TREE|nr:uncharacterized protein CC85DRAFT_206133 [Cutaneotrichosporon oleaginosum]KLT39177.1 hypothetical protein CC85DRAFT_206133 [Cutaneotrichosporon oleaginosum]